jgi:hypothetical protein
MMQSTPFKRYRQLNSEGLRDTGQSGRAEVQRSRHGQSLG